MSEQQRSPDYRGFMEAMTAWAVVNAPRFALEASVVEGPIRRSLVDLGTGQPLFPDSEWPDETEDSRGRKVLAEIEAEREAAPKHTLTRSPVSGQIMCSSRCQHPDHFPDPDPVPPAGAPAIGTRWQHRSWDAPRPILSFEQYDYGYYADFGDALRPRMSLKADGSVQFPREWTEHPPENAPAIGTRWRIQHPNSKTSHEFTVAGHEKVAGYWMARDERGTYQMTINPDGSLFRDGWWSEVVPEPEPDRPEVRLYGEGEILHSFTLVDTPYGQVLALKEEK